MLNDMQISEMENKIRGCAATLYLISQSKPGAEIEDMKDACEMIAEILTRVQHEITQVLLRKEVEKKRAMG